MKTRKLWLVIPLAGLLAFLIGACGDGGSDTTITVDGSSTVGPLTEAAAELFQGENDGVNVTVGVSGTGGGFEKFCAGETDISDASRAIEPDEVDACKTGGITYKELQVANDGLAVVVNPNNDFAKCLTVDQLKSIWETDSKVTNWNQVDPSFPDLKMELFGPGTDSGTFDFFTDKINGEEGASRTDYNASEDDNVTVEGVSGSEGGIGYFGQSYAEQNPDSVKTVEVDGGEGCVAPTAETVQSGKYVPLSRPLLIYPSDAALERQEVKDFVQTYVENLPELTKQALFVGLTTEQQAKTEATLEEILGGGGSGTSTTSTTP